MNDAAQVREEGEGDAKADGSGCVWMRAMTPNFNSNILIFHKSGSYFPIHIVE